MKTDPRTGVQGYTIAEAQAKIGAAHDTYVRILASQGVLRKVGKCPQSEGSEVELTLLSIEDVDKKAAKFQTRSRDDNHKYSMRLTEEQVDKIAELWPELEVEDETTKMRVYMRGRNKAKKAEKLAAKNSQA